MSYTAARFEPGPPRPVGTHISGGRWTLVFTQVFPHPPEAVWAALTDPAELPAWAPYTASRHLGRTGPATLTMIDTPDGPEMDGTVTVAEPPEVLEHAWGLDRLRWELTSVPAGTELVLSHTLDDAGLLATIAAGWHLCLLVAERFLDGTPIGPIVGQDAMNYGFEPLRDAYEAVINPG